MVDIMLSSVNVNPKRILGLLLHEIGKSLPQTIVTLPHKQTMFFLNKVGSSLACIKTQPLANLTTNQGFAVAASSN